MFHCIVVPVTPQAKKTGKSVSPQADTPTLSTEHIIAQLNQLHDLIRQNHARS